MMKKEKFTKLLSDILREWKWLLKYVRRYWWSIALYIFIGVCASLMGLGASVASKYLIDAVVDRDETVILTAVAAAVGLGVAQIAVNALSSHITSRVGTKVNMEIRSDFFDQITSAEWEEINKYHSGDLINRLEGDVTLVSSAAISFLPGVFTRLAQFIGALAVVLYYDPTMALLALLSSPVVFLTSRLMMSWIRKYNKYSRETNGKILSFGEETLQNLQTVKAFGLAAKYAENFKALLTQYRSVKLDHDKFSILMTLCLSLVGLAVSYSCFGWGVWRLWSGAISYGTMTLFIQLSSVLTTSFSALVSLAPSAVSIATSSGRVMELLNLSKEKDLYEKEALELLEKSKTQKLTVKAENLSFRYMDGETRVIKNSDFYISSGETVAIIGHSGDGKTTALKLLLGLIHPTEGRITLSSEDGQTLDISRSTRRLCSYVPQTSSIISGTVAENLRAVKPEATEEEMINALKKADAWSFISELPDGINSHIEERNINFSEGQAQRISIARALLRKSPILLMDEATSALDAETEERVLHNIMTSNPRRICIITTHRPSMLAYCDRIYRINEDGGFETYHNS